MSKKAKRIRAMQQASKKPAAPVAEKPLRQVNTEIKPAATHSRNSAVVQESQYKYIMPELIRIAIIAAVFFIIIIILSFIVK